MVLCWLSDTSRYCRDHKNKQISGVIERAGFLFCFVLFLRVVNTHFVVFKLPGSSFLARGRWCGRKMDGRLAGGV